MKKLSLTILMPCLNEEKTIGICIKKAKKFLEDNSINGEILIADNGTSDSSVEIAEKLGARVINVVDRGYGNALKNGIKEAHSDFIIYGDCDDSYDFSELKSKNSDTVAWLNVDSTYINYPVVQTSDNQYYLKHSFIKEKKQSGWPFMDYRNHKDMSDKNTIFYGHNLLNKNSFGSLSFLFEDSWKKSSNRKIVVLTENKQYIYEIFSIYYSDSITNYLQINFSDDNSYLTFLNNIKEKSLVDLEVQFTVSDRIITLSTCTEDNQGRKVVYAKLIYEGNR